MKNYKSSLLLFFALLCFHSTIFSDEEKKHAAPSMIRFTENKNQWDKHILYRAELDGGALFLEKNCFTYSFYNKETINENHVHLEKERGHHSASEQTASSTRSHAFRMTFVNASTTVETVASQPTSDYCNYFIGSDKSKWASNVKNYKEVNYRNIYKEINLQIFGLQNSIKYNFYVSPQGNTEDIQLLYEGLESITLEEGTLRLKTSLNELVEQRPYAYQKIKGKLINVPCQFVLDGTSLRFNFPKGYNKKYELVIDPVLIFAATSGSTANNFGHTGTYDADGNLYSGGIAFSQGYPTTLGAYDRTFNGGNTDVVITKYDSSGTFLRYSTYLGGSAGDEIVTSLIVDAQNNLYMYGVTGSGNFPVTANAYEKTFKGGTNYYPNINNGNLYYNGTDIFVAELNATGSSLLASTFIGGSGNDGLNSNNILTTVPLLQNGIPVAFTNLDELDSLQYNYGDYYRGEIDLDKAGNVVIVTSTRSSDFPIINGFDNTLGGKQDAVVFKMNTNLSQLMWSTYLGGTDNDCANGLILDDSANVYVVGGTRSGNFPTTSGTLQTSAIGGKADGYITKIKKDGSSILSSTYWGTTAYDQCYFIQLDKSNNVYAFGQSEGAMPVTSGVYNNPSSGQFITKINNSLSNVVFSTVFGNRKGGTNISPTAFLVDNCENIYVSGWASGYNSGRDSTMGMPVTPDGLDTTTAGYDFYLMALTTNASSLLYATYFGGNQSKEHVHGGTSRYDKKGIIYQSLCTGCGGFDDFPGTPGAYPNTGSDWNHTTDNCNNGVFKLNFQQPLTIADFIVDHQTACVPQTINFTNKSTSARTFLWDFGGGDTTSTVVNPVRTYSVAGTYMVKLYVNNPANCNAKDSLFRFITINQLPIITNKNKDTICSGTPLRITQFTSSIASSYTWIASNNSNITGESTTLKSSSSINDILVNTTTSNQTITYTITPTSIAGGCVGSSQVLNVLVYPAPSLTTSLVSSICSGSTLNIPLGSSIASTYKWVATDNLNTFGESTLQHFTSTINDVLTNQTSSLQTVAYIVIPTSVSKQCVGSSATVNVLVYPASTITTNNSFTICSGNKLSIPITSDISSTFKWVATNNPTTTGESFSQKTNDTINDVIINTTTSVQTVTYTITPTSSTGGCVGNEKTISVQVYPAPSVTTTATSSVCSGVALTISLGSTVGSTYTWLAADNTNTIGESTTQQMSSIINDAITNLTSIVQVVIYTVIPTSVSGGCMGTAKMLTVSVHPAPSITTTSVSSICSGLALNISLGSTIASTYTWITAENANTTGESTIQQTTNKITDVLTNLTSTLQTISYTVTPSSASKQCVGNATTINVSVYPAPTITTTGSFTVCSGIKLSIPLTSDVTSIFKWITINNPNTTGESFSQKTNDTINDVIMNITSSVQTVTYTVTPISSNSGCAGNTKTISVLVYPAPSLTIATTSSICSGSAATIPLGSNIVSTYTWLAVDNVNTTGESTTPQSNNNINDVITNITSTVQPVTYSITPTSVSGGCTGTIKTVTVSVHPAPSVTTTAVYSICSGNLLNIPLGSTIASTYKWIATENANTTGESTVQKSTNIINNLIINQTNSLQTVIYTVTPTSSAEGCLGRAQTLSVSVYPVPTITTTAVASICSGIKLSIRLASDIISTFKWSTTNNPNTTGESFSQKTNDTINDVIINITTSVQTVTYTITPTSSTGGCIGNKKTITVSVYPAPSVTTTAVASICSGSTLNILLGSNMASTYTWLAAENANTLGESTTLQSGSSINDVITNLISTVQPVIYTITPTSVSGVCMGTVKTLTVSVHPAPSITTTAVASICSGNTLNINLGSTVTSGYKWIATNNANTTGESTVQKFTATINDVIINQTNSLQTVNYTVTPTSSTSGCLGIPKTLTISIYPLPTITSKLSDTICNNERLNNQLQSAISGTYKWKAINNPFTSGESSNDTFTNFINDSITNMSTSTQIINYSITPVSTDNCVGNTVTYTVTVYPGVTPKIGFTSVPCTNQINFNDLTNPTPSSWLWDFGDLSATNFSTLQNPSHIFSLPTTYTITLDITYNSGNGTSCISSADTTIDLTRPITSVNSTETICKYTTTLLNATGGTTYSWKPTNSLSNSFISNPIASPTVTTTYTVYISTINSFGNTCIDILTTKVNVTDPALYTITAASDKDTILQGESTSLHAITDNTLTVNWKDGTGTLLPATKDITVSPQSTTTYTVSILDSVGCPKTATVTVIVVPNTCDVADIFIPNTFTPNGDTKNDILYVRGNNISELYFAVYNRWGQIVFETKDITKGWNGVYNDMKADPVVFAWYLEAKCYNGQQIIKKGNVTVIR